jgi:hypothetical protein
MSANMEVGVRIGSGSNAPSNCGPKTRDCRSFDNFVAISNQAISNQQSACRSRAELRQDYFKFSRGQPTTEQQQAHQGRGREWKAVLSVCLGFDKPLPCPCRLPQFGKWRGAAADGPVREPKRSRMTVQKPADRFMPPYPLAPLGCLCESLDLDPFVVRTASKPSENIQLKILR